MNTIRLNFAPPSNTVSILGSLLLMAVLVVMALVYVKQQALTEAIAVKTRPPQPLSRGGYAQAQASVDTAFANNTQLAQTVQQQLNVPWMAMLAGLEQMKKTNPNIDLLSIAPNKQRASIALTGEAATFADITQLVDALRAHPAFGDAVLLNHHLEQDAVHVVYVFEISVGWRI